MLNSGTADLNVVELEQKIPVDMKPPTLVDVDVFFRDSEVKKGVTLSLDPEDENPGIEHTLKVKIEDLSGSVGGVSPNEAISIKFPIVAMDPKPNMKYIMSTLVSSNVTFDGPPIKFRIPERDIGIKYVRRRTRAFKSVNPGVEEGEYVISIVFMNKSEVAVENVIIRDLIPKTYIFAESTPKEIVPTTSDDVEGTRIEWVLSSVDANSDVNIEYSIRGSGEYISEDPEIIIG